MDFKAQILEDLKVFHNLKEFATMTNLWYDGGCYTVPIIIDHETTKEIFIDFKQYTDLQIKRINV